MTTQRSQKAKKRQFGGKTAASVATAAVLATDPAAASSHVGNHATTQHEQTSNVVDAPPQQTKPKGKVETTTLPPGAMLCYTFKTPLVLKPFSLNTIRDNSIEIPANSSLSQEVQLPEIEEFISGRKKTPFVLTAQSGVSLHLTYKEIEAIVAQFPVMSEEDQQWLIQNPLCGYGGAFVLEGKVYIPRTTYIADTLAIEHVPLLRKVTRAQFAACLARR